VALALAPAASRAGEGAPAAPASPRPRVALEKLRAAGVSEPLAQAVEERVCATLLEVAKAEVVCPADVAAASALAKNAAMFGECQPDDCLRRVDQLRAAERHVTGAIEQGEKGLVLSLQLTGPSGPGPRVVETLPADLEPLLSRVPAVVQKLFAQR
jgi:hypothetical protein